MSALQQLWDRTVAVFLPARCIGCGAFGSYLCDQCVSTLPRLQPLLCPGCALHGWQEPCKTCRLQPLALHGVAAPLVYNGVAKRAVHLLKYRNLLALAPSMAVVMAQALRRASPPVDGLVPVLLHPRQLRRRGYNQSALLANEVGKLLGIPVWDTVLRRVHEGRPQVTLSSREERRANVAYAFESTTSPASGASLEGKDLWLVDEVMTTGSTFNAAASALLKAVARIVGALVFARDV